MYPISHTEHCAGWMCTCVLSWREHFGILFEIFHLLFSTEKIEWGNVYRNIKELLAPLVKALCMFLCVSSWLCLLRGCDG